MSLIRKFLESKKKLLSVEKISLYEQLKEVLLDCDKELITFENSTEIKNGLTYKVNRLLFAGNVLYEEKKDKEQTRELRIFDPNKNKIVYYKKISENNDTINEKIFRKRFSSKSNFFEISEDIFNISLQGIHLYFNTTTNKINILNKQKELRNIIFFNKDYTVEESKTESTKKFSLLNGFMELFKEVQPIERKEGSTLYSEYNDQNIGKIKITVNYNATTYSFFDTTGQKIIEEEYENGKKKTLKLFKDNICRYKEVFEDNDKNLFYYNKQGELRVSNIINKKDLVNGREIIYNPAEVKSKEIKKQIRECFDLKFSFVVAGKMLEIIPNLRISYEDKSGVKVDISKNNIINEYKLQKLKSLIEENVIQNELNRRPLGIIQQVVRKIKCK